MTRVNAIETLTSSMEPDPIANAVCDLMVKFVRQRSDSDEQRPLDDSDDEIMAPEMDQVLNHIVDTAILRMVTDEYIKKEGGLEADDDLDGTSMADSGISSPECDG